MEQFAADIKRYQDGYPISALADSHLYRATKFLRRNKILVSAVAIVVVAVLGGLAAALWQARVSAALRKRWNRVRRLERRRHAGVKRQRRQRDDEAQRDRERSHDGVDQPGGGNGRLLAAETGGR